RANAIALAKSNGKFNPRELAALSPIIAVFVPARCDTKAPRPRAANARGNRRSVDGRFRVRAEKRGLRVTRDGRCAGRLFTLLADRGIGPCRSEKLQNFAMRRGRLVGRKDMARIGDQDEFRASDALSDQVAVCRGDKPIGIAMYQQGAPRNLRQPTQALPPPHPLDPALYA